MKKVVSILLIIPIIACSNISVIEKSDYREIKKENQVNILKTKLEKEKYRYTDKVVELISSQYEANNNELSVYYIETLASLMLKDVKYNDEKIKQLYELEDYDINEVFNYLGLFEMKRNNYRDAYNDLWISKSRKNNYLSNELFMHLINNKDNSEEIIADMEKQFPDYPLNKYNKLVNKTLYEIDEIKLSDFNEARKDLKKINSKFYPEIEVYKIKFLMILDLMEANYLYHIKDFEKLRELKIRVNKSDLKDKLDLERFNGFVDFRLSKGEIK